METREKFSREMSGLNLLRRWLQNGRRTDLKSLRGQNTCQEETNQANLDAFQVMFHS